MNVLWLSKRSHYSSRRVQAVTEALHVNVSVREVPEIWFSADGNRLGVFSHAVNLVQTNDVLVVRTFYPQVSEVLTIARLFHDAGKLVIDENVINEGYAISKMHDYLILASNNINIPRTWQVYGWDNVRSILDTIGYPCILKGVHGYHGTRVHLVQTETEAMECFAKYDSGDLCIQEFLPAHEDYRVLVIGYEALPKIVSRKPYPGEFVTNSAANAEFSAREIDDFPGLQEVAERAARTLRREFAAVDIRYRNGTPLVLEVNRQPTFEGFELATSIDVASAFLHYIETRFQQSRG
jgi:glutathione synthase/RimK-type ligase-like ATP-grasp enzyme